MRAGFREVVLAVVACAVLAPPCRARLLFPSVVDRTLGIEAAGSTFRPFESDRARVEVADMALFGIAGLQVAGVRGAVAPGAWTVRAELARIASPVGSESRVAVDAGFTEHGRWSIAVRAGLAGVAIAGAPGENRPIAGVTSRVDVGSVTTCADIESAGLGADRRVAMHLALAARIAPGIVVSTFHVDGPGTMAVAVAAGVRLHPSLALLTGYDDGTETLSGVVAVRVRGCELAAGVYRHAVLGLSQGVTLTWSR